MFDGVLIKPLEENCHSFRGVAYTTKVPGTSNAQKCCVGKWVHFAQYLENAPCCSGDHPVEYLTMPRCLVQYHFVWKQYFMRCLMQRSISWSVVQYKNTFAKMLLLSQYNRSNYFQIEINITWHFIEKMMVSFRSSYY